MHTVNKRDINSAELETVRTSRSPTTVMTANGEVQTREEATVYVKELDLFVTVMLLEETPAVVSFGKLCEDHGYGYHWTSGHKPHLTKNGKRIDCNMSNFLPFVVPGLSASSSNTSTPTCKVRVRSYWETRCMNQQKPKTKIEMKDAKMHKAIYYMNCRIGCRSSERIWSMNVVFQSHGVTLSLDIETLPVLLMSCQWSREQKWNRIRVSIRAGTVAT